MKKSETARIIAKLMTVYPSFKFGENVLTGKDNTLEEVVNVWHGLIGEMDYAKADKAVDMCIRECKFVPSIAEITAKYDGLIAEANKDEREIREYYERTRSYYPGSGDYNYGWEEWLTRVSEASDRVSAARWLNNRITQYVNSCEKETMDFAECIKTIK